MIFLFIVLCVFLYFIIAALCVLINEWINEWIALHADHSRAADSVKCVFPEDLAEAVFTHVTNIQEIEFQKTKDHHKKKFRRLLEAKKKQETSTEEVITDDQCDRWVINLSHTELNTQQKNILVKGLNLAISLNTLPSTQRGFCGSSRESMPYYGGRGGGGFSQEVLGTLCLAQCSQYNLTIQ